jgi:hypothetical protein
LDRTASRLYQRRFVDYPIAHNLIGHTHTTHTMSDLTPQQIRDEFASLWEDQVIGKEYLLRALSNYVSTDILAEFMDDLAMGRV